jgi:hypothetical protein
MTGAESIRPNAGNRIIFAPADVDRIPHQHAQYLLGEIGHPWPVGADLLQDFCCETLVKAFPDELAGGKARLKHRLCTKLVERIDAGDWNAIQFGFRHVFGWKDKDANGEDDGYSRLPLDQLVETLAARAKALGLHIDLSYKFHDPGRFGGTAEPKLIEGVVKGSEEEKR